MGQGSFSSQEMSSPAMVPTQPTVQCALLHFPGVKAAGPLS